MKYLKNSKNIHSPFEPDKSMSIESLKKIPPARKSYEKRKTQQRKTFSGGYFNIQAAKDKSITLGIEEI